MFGQCIPQSFGYRAGETHLPALVFPNTAAVVPSTSPVPLVAWNHHCKARGDAVSWQQGCSPLFPNPTSLSQLGQHPTDSRDPAGPGAADTQGNRQQQRETADAEHQCWLPVPENSHPTHGWGEAQQGEQDSHIGSTRGGAESRVGGIWVLTR